MDRAVILRKEGWFHAAPWFDQKGGAPQFRTTVTAAELVADGTLERVEAARPFCG